MQNEIIRKSIHYLRLKAELKELLYDKLEDEYGKYAGDAGQLVLNEFLDTLQQLPLQTPFVFNQSPTTLTIEKPFPDIIALKPSTYYVFKELLFKSRLDEIFLSPAP